MARKSYYTRESIMNVLMKIMFRADGSRRSYRDMAENSQLLKITRWSKTSKSHLGSFSRMLEGLNISEITLYEEAKRLFLIPQHMEFSEFSQNKKLNYEKQKEDSTLSKSIPKNKQLKELCYRLGVTDEDIDISVLTENEVYEFLYAMGYTQFDIDKINDDIKNIKYMGK